MPKSRRLKINVSKEIGKVSSILLLPEKAKALIVLSHGAGAGMEHSFMEALAKKLAEHDIGTLRFNFAYMEKGGGPPDRPKKAHQVIAAAISKALNYSEGLTLLAGGKSFGGRMMSQMAAAGTLKDVKGVIYFGFPLHAPGKPGTERAAHLSDIKIPQLFVQGTRDTLAKIDLIKAVAKRLKKASLAIIDGGDHSFKMLKRSGKTQEDAIEEIAKASEKFIDKL